MNHAAMEKNAEAAHSALVLLPSDAPLEAKVRAAMRGALEANYIEEKEEAVFRAAVAGVLISLDRESADYKSIVDSFEAFRLASAFLSCRSMGMSVSLPEYATKQKVPLYALWVEVRSTTKTKVELT